MQANPLLSNAAGEFDPVYLLEGQYRAVISDPNGVELARFDDVDVRDLVGVIYTDLDTLLVDRALGYTGDTGRQVMLPGTIIDVAQGKLSYKVLASDATENVHLVTAGGVKLQVEPTAAGYFNALAWNPARDGTTDDTNVLQVAMDFAHDRRADLYIPAGTYSVTTLTIPGTASNPDERGQALRIFGQGYGEPFAAFADGGTKLVSSTAPVLQDILDTDPSSNGTIQIDRMHIEGNSDTEPVILLQSFYGLSSLRDLSVRQSGAGDGIYITYSATTDLDNIYVMNRDFVTIGLGASRVGVGVRHQTSHDAALVTFRKVTSRGFHTGFKFGGSVGREFTLTLSECECSAVYDGVVLDDTRGAIIEKCYIEGGEGGTGILDGGDYTTIRDCLLLPGFGIGIDATDVTTKGTLVEGNSISTGSTENAVGIDVVSSAAFGGYNKTVRSNTVIYSEGTNGVTGIRIGGTQPRLSVVDNCFDPRSDWSGTNSNKIDNQALDGITGLLQQASENSELVMLSQGAMSLFQRDSALTDLDVTGSTLALPSGSYFRLAAPAAVGVFSFDAGLTNNRLIVLRSENANMTINNSLQISLNGGTSFSGPGILTLIVQRIGALSYAFEVSRSVY